MKAWCEPAVGVATVLQICEVDEGLLLVLQGSNETGSAMLLRPGCRDFSLVRSESDPELSPLLKAWPAPNGALLQVGSTLLYLSGRGSSRRLVCLPEGTKCVDATWNSEHELVVVALSHHPWPQPAIGSGGEEPVVWPSSPSSLLLRRFTQRFGWEHICQVASTACSLAISADGSWAGWCVRDTDDDEGTGAGEFEVSRLERAAKIAPLTVGAGTCGSMLISPDGSGVVYLAKHVTGAAEFEGSCPLSTPLPIGDLLSYSSYTPILIQVTIPGRILKLTTTRFNSYSYPFQTPPLSLPYLFAFGVDTSAAYHAFSKPTSRPYENGPMFVLLPIP